MQALKHKKQILSSSSLSELIKNLNFIIHKDVNFQFERYMGQYPFQENYSKSSKLLNTTDSLSQESQNDSGKNEMKSINDISEKVEMAKSGLSRNYNYCY